MSPQTFDDQPHLDRDRKGNNNDRPAFAGAPEPEALLTRVPTAENLTRAGFRISPKTLATMACRGGGPSFRKFGSRPLYRWADALAWAQGRLSEPRCNTSAQDVA